MTDPHPDTTSDAACGDTPGPRHADPGDAGRSAESDEHPDHDLSHPDHGLSYEQARQALGEVVQSLETGGITLAESIALWERGERLANVCQRLLDGAQERLDAAIERAQQEDAG